MQKLYDVLINLLQTANKPPPRILAHCFQSVYQHLSNTSYSMFAVGRYLDEDDNTKAEAAKMQKAYENLKDSTKEEQPPTETSQSDIQS